MKKIELPTGEIGEFPDTMSDEAIAAVLRVQFPASKAHLYSLPPAVQKHPWIQTALYGAKRPPVAETAKDLATLAQFATIPLGGAGATALAARTGLPWLMRAAPYAGRVLGAALPEAAVAPIAGQSPAKTGVTAAMGAAGGELAAGTATNVLQILKPVADKIDLKRLGVAVGEALPSFKTETAKDLYDLAKREGTRIRREMLDKAMDRVRGMLERRSPLLGIPISERLTVPSLGAEPVTLRKAVRTLQELDDRAHGVNPKVLGFEDRLRLRDAQAQYAKLRREIPAALEQVAPGAGQAFDDAYKTASAQSAYLSVMNKATREGNPNLRVAQKELLRDPEGLKRRFGQAWPGMERAIFRGNPTGPGALDRPGTGAWNELTSLFLRRLKGPEAPFVAGPATRTLADIAAQNPYVQAGGAVTLGELSHLLPFRQPRERIGFGQRY